MNKIALIAVVLAVVLVGAYFVSTTGFFSLPEAEVKNAVLLIDSGSVQVDSGSGFKEASSGMEIKESYKIKTLDNSIASLVLYDSTIARLDPNTEITLKELTNLEENNTVVIKQDSGKIWNQVLKVSGIGEYSVETPNSVATVRGTAFGVIIDGNETDFMVDRGIVDVKKTLGKIEQVLLNAQEGASVSDSMNKKTMGEWKQEKAFLANWLEGHVAKDNQFVEAEKVKIKKNISLYIELAKQKGVTDEQIDQTLGAYLRGELDVPSTGFDSKEEAKKFVNDFLNGKIDSVTAASKANQIQQMFK